MRSAVAFLADCPHLRSEHVVAKPDGIMAAAQRNVGNQKELLEHPNRLIRFRKLLEEMPPGEMPATGGEIDFKNNQEVVQLAQG